MKTDKSKELRKKFRREYFAMREVINSNEQLRAMALLKIAEGKTAEERIIGAKEYAELKIKEETKLLTIKNEELKQELNIITKKHTDWNTINEINKALRALAQRCYSSDYSKCYSRLYKKLKDNNGIDLKTRKTNYINKTGKKSVTYLHFLKENEVSVVKDIVFSACIKNGINLNRLLYVEDVFSGGHGYYIDSSMGFDK